MMNFFAITLVALFCLFSDAHSSPIRKGITPRPDNSSASVDALVLGVNKYSVVVFKRVFRGLTEQSLIIGKVAQTEGCGTVLLDRLDRRSRVALNIESKKTLLLVVDPRDMIIHQKNDISSGVLPTSKYLSKKNYDTFLSMNEEDQISYLIEKKGFYSIKKIFEKIAQGNSSCIVRVEDLISPDVSVQKVAINSIADFFDLRVSRGVLDVLCSDLSSFGSRYNSKMHGVWREGFSEKNAIIFNKKFNDKLILLGY